MLSIYYNTIRDEIISKLENQTYLCPMDIVCHKKWHLESKIQKSALSIFAMSTIVSDFNGYAHN